MRILLTTSPGIGHIFPLIPTAWALRAAGHEVIMAAPSHTDLVRQAGLLAVDPAPGFDFPSLFMGFQREYPAELMRVEADQPGRTQAGIAFATTLFGKVSEPSVARTVSLAKDWQPDLIVHGPLHGAGSIAAAVIGVPTVVHGIAPGQGAELWSGVAEAMAETYVGYGVTATPPAAFLDVSPPSMRPRDTQGWSLRYVPFNGGGVLEDWLTQPRQRPRVTVTLGSVVPRMAGVGVLGRLVEAASSVDAEFVFALGGGDLSALGQLPANVRVVGWTPLNALLRASDAVVHHGGAGSTLTALATATPQLILPQAADQFLNAAAVARAGAGERVDAEQIDAQRITALLTDQAMRAKANHIAGEMSGQPSPGELVEDIVALAK